MNDTTTEPAVPPIATLPVSRASFRTDAAVALSFANLCYLRLWSELLTYSPADAYKMKLPFSREAYIAVVLNVVVAAAAGLGVAALLRRSGRRWAGVLASILFLAALAIPANALRSVLSNFFQYLRSPLLILLGTRGAMMLGGTLALAAIVVAVVWTQPVIRFVRNVLLILFPLVPLTFAQSLWRAASYDASGFEDSPSAPALPRRDGPRVLWIVLDEMDQRLAFVDRPSGIQLPELDRLRGESLFAHNAQPPGWETLLAMPALLSGRDVKDAVKGGPHELLLVHPGGQPPVPWRDEPNVFAKARAAGFNTALVGWYHPYCRELASSLTHCEWWEMSMQYNSSGRTLLELMPGQTRSLFETSLLSLFGQSLSTRAHGHMYREMMPRSLAVAADRAYGLALLHLPVPHAPHAWDRHTGRFDLKNAPVKGYIDSLVLADRSLGEIRRTLEAAGMWQTTTVLVTSDHGYRASKPLDGKTDPRVPFVLKMAGTGAPVDFTPCFNARLTGDLLISVLRGEVSTPQDAARWIEAHAAASAR